MGLQADTSITILLTGDLGSGKTAFVQGLAKGLDVPEEYYITSPTYTLLNEYPGRFPLFHFDFYRLEDMEDIYSTGFFDIINSNGIIVAEWADRISGDLEMDHVRIEFIVHDDDTRTITVYAIGPDTVRLIEKLSI
jgi:tRNA threonylcarbamoyladenosine biosynthesis protein TsaE